MALMMVFMVAFLVAVPGGHMDLLGSHHSTEEASQSHQHDGAKPKPEPAQQSQGQDATTPNQAKP